MASLQPGLFDVSQMIPSLSAGFKAVAAAPRVRQEAQQRTEALTSMTQAAAGGDPAQMLQVAQQLAKVPGMETQAMQLAQMAQKATQNAAAKQALFNRQEALATTAESMLLPEVAKNIRATTDEESLRAIAKDLRAQQIKKLPTQTPAVRRTLANTAGITPQQFQQMGLDKVSDTEFDAVIGGQKGNIEPWMTTDGQIKGYRVNEFGNVYSEESQSWVSPASLDLQQAPPSIQRVENIASTMQGELVKQGAERFFELGDQARNSAESIRSIDNILGDIDQMFTGSLADVNLQVQKFMKAVGIKVDDLAIENTEAFNAAAASRVAEYIKNLGAGTGLSDKDLDFTLKVVAGRTTLDSNTIKRVLNEYRDAAARKIEGYNDMRSNILKTIPNDSATAAFYPVVQVPARKTSKFEGFSIVEE